MRHEQKAEPAKAASTTAAPPPPAQVDPPVLTEANIVEAVDAAMTLGMLNQVDFASLTELKKKYKLALISNSDCFSIEDIIDKYDLRKFFDVIVLSYEAGVLKTDKKMFQIVLKKLKVKKDEAVMVGDSIDSDMIGAENAGVKAVLVDRKGKREYVHKVADLSEVKDMISKLK